MSEDPSFQYTLHKKVKKYRSRQRKSIRIKFDDAVEKIVDGPYPQDDPLHISHLKAELRCLHRYALKKGPRGLRIIYDVDLDNSRIDFIAFGPRGDIY